MQTPKQFTRPSHRLHTQHTQPLYSIQKKANSLVFPTIEHKRHKTMDKSVQTQQILPKHYLYIKKDVRPQNSQQIVNTYLDQSLLSKQQSKKRQIDVNISGKKRQKYDYYSQLKKRSLLEKTLTDRKNTLIKRQKNNYLNIAEQLKHIKRIKQSYQKYYHRL